MSSLLDASPLSVLDVLRGERTSRPPANDMAAPGLRALVEDSIYEVLGPTLRNTPLVVRASSFREATASPATSYSSLARVRGVLINQLLRLLSVGLNVEDAVGESMLAWRAEVGTNDLTDFVDQLSDDERARLATDVTAHGVTLQRSLGSLSSRWMPRTSLRAYQRLAGGNVVLRDVTDLMVGTTTSDEASVALLDVTTSPLGESHERVMRYHALVQTLRTGVVPLRTATFSTATGELWCVDVDEELLVRSVRDVIDVVASWSL
ncbi:MAG: hypothetical protein JWM55_1868 [Acidimicrobiaceae bacterium]|nr:hypothetical protein [Acidimicrobiaceae bacterium]